MWRPYGCSLLGAGRSDVDRRGALLSVLDLELNSLILGERFETLLLDGAEVDEDILGAVAGRDEAEAFGFVEPLDLALDLIRHPDEGCAENSCGVLRWLRGSVLHLQQRQLGRAARLGAEEVT